MWGRGQGAVFRGGRSVWAWPEWAWRRDGLVGGRGSTRAGLCGRGFVGVAWEKGIGWEWPVWAWLGRGRGLKPEVLSLRQPHPAPFSHPPCLCAHQDPAALEALWSPVCTVLSGLTRTPGSTGLSSSRPLLGALLWQIGAPWGVGVPWATNSSSASLASFLPPPTWRAPNPRPPGVPTSPPRGQDVPHSQEQRSQRHSSSGWEAELADRRPRVRPPVMHGLPSSTGQRVEWLSTWLFEELQSSASQD